MAVYHEICRIGLEDVVKVQLLGSGPSGDPVSAVLVPSALPFKTYGVRCLDHDTEIDEIGEFWSR